MFVCQLDIELEGHDLQIQIAANYYSQITDFMI
jgi:hypothetical protein